MSLADAVARALERNVTALEDVSRATLAYDAFLAGRTVSRLRGVAVTPASRLDWSLIEKATEGPRVATPYLYDNALREVRAYESGLLADLAPGLAAPRCFAAETGADGALTLWLEDLEAFGTRLTSTDLVQVAGDFGRFAGRWAARVPADTWLFQGWLDRHIQPDATEPALVRLRALDGDRDVERRLGWPIERAIKLIERQSLLRATLDETPRTLCHHDAVAANVFRRRSGGRVETVLIDWESVGPGAVGTDLASLLFASARRGDIPATAIPDLLDDAIEAYSGGLGEGGAEVDRDALWLAVHAAIALRWTLARDVALAVAYGTPVFRGSAPSESARESLEQLIMLSGVLLRSAEEAWRFVSVRNARESRGV